MDFGVGEKGQVCGVEVLRECGEVGGAAFGGAVVKGGWLLLLLLLLLGGVPAREEIDFRDDVDASGEGGDGGAGWAPAGLHYGRLEEVEVGKGGGGCG